ncbi:OLC1v1018505C1 [Oldenlandia corymbosa var. corymbosa]|uniref:OLC1v1018505C1 n=1 Tax=Oldenlandia corymbosa var. corymbosa TaxID=529605 RepID=A0AAV1EBY5_OLDCO|nr:OLC1v1018505C1 [Oldenlandia corymbosa var. corymbosa]
MLPSSTKSAAFFCFFFLLSLTATFSFAAKCYPDDLAGLLAFKSGITSDPSGILLSWKSGTDCCTWNGITCNPSGVNNTNRVTSISLYAQPDNPRSILSGTISPSLSKLHYLTGIYFSDLRNLSGPFPDFFFRLPRLAFVYIENNRLSGPLPESIGNMTQLQAFSLQGNRFTGRIPSSIGKLTQLGQLKLGQNLFTGTIPVSIRALRDLTLLMLDHNQLTGTIPDFFSTFRNLISLDLRANQLTGTIPPSVSTLFPNLRYLELGHNRLTGKIPDFLGNFRALDTLDLSWNNFSGTVPKTFANLTKIFNLDLSHNHLVDPFPTLYVKGIESIDLSYNQFHLVNIPPWITSSPIIYSLKLAKCGLKLKLDDWKPSETYFYDYIDLSENEITGSPFKILNSTEYLVGFYASGNKLQFDLGTLRLPKTLKFLDLSRNLVKGKVPSTVSGLQSLNVSYNHLCGQLPSTKFPASAFAGNDCLCGPPLPPCK